MTSFTPCTCAPAELVSLSKMDRKDPIVRNYLAPPAPPTANLESAMRTPARREAAGVGFALGFVAMVVLGISLAGSLAGLAIAVVLSLVIGYATRGIIWRNRMRAIDADELALEQQARAQTAAYETRREVWNHLYYCPSCRTIVDERTGASRPLHAIHELLVPASTTLVQRAPVA